MTDLADLLTVEEVAAQLGCSHRTVMRLIGAGRLGSVKVLNRRLVPGDAVDTYRARTNRAGS